MKSENWRKVPIEPFGGDYEVSDQGRLRRSTVSAKHDPVGKIIKPKVSRGYHQYKLCGGGERLFIGAHRLVALAFIGPPPSDKHQAAHWDGNKTNNVPSNLRWATSAENNGDKRRHGRLPTGDRNGARLYPDRLKRGDENGSRLYPERLAWGDKNWTRRFPEKVARGEKATQSKLKAADVLAIRAMAAQGHVNRAAVSRQYGVSEHAIYAIVTFKSWRHLPAPDTARA